MARGFFLARNVLFIKNFSQGSHSSARNFPRGKFRVRKMPTKKLLLARTTQSSRKFSQGKKLSCHSKKFLLLARGAQSARRF
jgi:hypothetical protein